MSVTTATNLSGTSLIGGESVAGTAGTVAGSNPRTGERLEPEYTLVGLDEVQRAGDLAWEAFRSYRHTAPDARAAFLETVADNVAALGETLVERVIDETGIIRPRVEGELGRTVNQLRLFAAVLREGDFHDARLDGALPERAPLPRPDIRLRKIGTGPVAVFGSSNFPLAFSVAGGDTASALAAGCPVVVKAHSAHPGTSELVGRAIVEAVAAHGLHPGVFALVFGSGRSVGTALVTHPRIASVGFTGSRSGGLALVAAAASRPEPIPVFAEMSSINPVFVLPGALETDAAALGAAWVGSVNTGIGQLCTSPGLVFVAEGPNTDAFIDGARAAVEQTSSGVMLSSGIRSAFTDGAAAFSSHSGVAAIGTGAVDESVVDDGLAQLYVTDAATFLADDSLQAEVFGPASLVVTVPDTSRMVALLEHLEGQLTVTIHGSAADPVAAELLDAAELKAGRVLFNGWPTGVEVVGSMVHGGPFPATSDPRSTSVGTLAIDRFLRPVSYQNVPPELLPEVLRDGNPLGVWRQVDGSLTKD